MKRMGGCYLKRSPEQWKQLIEELRSSGQPLKTFARLHGVSATTLRDWMARLCNEDKATPSKARSIVCQRGKGGLVELVAQQKAAAIDGRSAEHHSDVVRLLIGTGVCLELSYLPGPEYLALVARSYEAVGS